MNIYKSKNCKDCKSRFRCTKNPIGRVIYLSVNKVEMDKYYDIMKTEKNIKQLSKRKEIIEHLFGIIKRNWGYTYFIQKTIKKVKAEFNFICFIYNLKRVLNLVQYDELFRILKTA